MSSITIKKHNRESWIVIDFDLTIGCFHTIRQIYNIYKDMNSYTIQNPSLRSEQTYKDFKMTLQTLPETFRPMIFDFFAFTKLLKKFNYINKVILYSNNIYGKEWIDCCIRFINEQLNESHTELSSITLFDEIIYSLQVEPDCEADTRRTYREKSLKDLLQIVPNSNLNSPFIFFVDDIVIPSFQNNEIIKYINVSPYTICFNIDTICNRFSSINSNTTDPYLKDMMKELLTENLSSSLQYKTTITTDDIIQSKNMINELINWIELTSSIPIQTIKNEVNLPIFT